MSGYNEDHYRFRRTGDLGWSDLCIRKRRRKRQRLGMFFLLFMILLAMAAYCLAT